MWRQSLVHRKLPSQNAIPDEIIGMRLMHWLQLCTACQGPEMQAWIMLQGKGEAIFRLP